MAKKLPPPAKSPSAPPQQPPLPAYDSGHTGTSYVSPAAPAPVPPGAAPGAAKVSTADKAREQAYHALHKGQSTLGSLFHQAAGSVQSHTQGTRAGGIGGQTAQFLDKVAHTIEGPAGKAPHVQALVTEGGQLLQNVFAQLPDIVPDKKINGHAVRQYHEWIANIRVEYVLVPGLAFNLIAWLTCAAGSTLLRVPSSSMSSW